MQLTKFTDYGLRTLMYLAANPERLSSVKEIAEHFDISRNHLVKVVHRLSTLGYIASTKGKGGGIKLQKDPEMIRLGDVIEQLEPDMNVVECFDPTTNTCNIIGTCQLKHFLSDASRQFLVNMNRHSLADTIRCKELVFDLS
ncbi:Rrf2 family transcriptional regulator [Flexibacterium corallicola]|uniref:Rrf2 family transcriptional regulator n=1 Tax=Flexibacterium corallicola TaxID=3037259 RepID=UPI00286F3E55|nr:Rrf2 family transcriptional regulator [Pseudovibrio sp. M1P-2-3]